MKPLLGLITIFAGSAILILINGAIVAAVWNWHIAHIAGVSLSTLEGIGIMLFYALFPDVSAASRIKEVHEELVITVRLLVLGFAWVVEVVK